jgi:signal transduction histidine kinase
MLGFEANLPYLPQGLNFGKAQGFNVAAMKNKGLGLVSVRERVQLLNGTIDVDSRPNVGTRIRARVPLAAESPTLSLATN